jgi:threonine dehydrogenase-like Zn-dependent dehydrogenase
MARSAKSAHGAKSKAIREYIATHKRAKASEIVAALAEQGLTVSPAMVYNTKARKRMGRRRKKAEAAGQVVGLSITNLIAAKKLVDQVGGIDQAREAINALSKLE